MSEKLGPLPCIRLFTSDDQGRVLILKRANTSHGDGLWCLPGGMLDYGETMVQGAQRELREETGLECREIAFEFIQDSLPPRPGEMHCLNIYFSCRVSGPVRINVESKEYAWIEPADAGGYAWAFNNDLGLKQFWRQNGVLEKN